MRGKIKIKVKKPISNGGMTSSNNSNNFVGKRDPLQAIN